MTSTRDHARELPRRGVTARPQHFQKAAGKLDQVLDSLLPFAECAVEASLHKLKRLGLPVICIDAGHAKAVLKMQVNKSDRNDAIGIAGVTQTRWFKEVYVKDIDSHSVRALPASRVRLAKIKRDLENHVRGLLKNLGLVIGRAKFNVFAVRAEELIEGGPELVAAIRPLLEARSAVEQQVSERNWLAMIRRSAGL